MMYHRMSLRIAHTPAFHNILPVKLELEEKTERLDTHRIALLFTLCYSLISSSYRDTANVSVMLDM